MGFVYGYMVNFFVVLYCVEKSLFFLLETLYITGESCYSFTTSHRGGGWKRRNKMKMQTTKCSYTRATLTPEAAMKLIQHIAAYGTEALHLDVQVTRYSEDDAVMHISVNNGFGVMLNVTEAMATVTEARA